MPFSKKPSGARLRTPVAAVLAASLTAAALARAGRADSADKLTVFTTLQVLASIALDVGGSLVAVKRLVRPDEERRDGATASRRARKRSPAEAAATSGSTVEIPGEEIAADAGDPHVRCEPLVGHIYAKHIEACLAERDSAHQAAWEKNREAFDRKLDAAVFGEALCDIVGGRTLERLARRGELEAFLATNEVPEGFARKGEKLGALRGGLLKKAEPLRGAKLVASRGSWAHFARTYGCEIVAVLEPRPGQPPTARHRADVVAIAREKGARVVLCTSHERRGPCDALAAEIGGTVALLPADVGALGTKDFIDFQTALVARVVDALAGIDAAS